MFRAAYLRLSIWYVTIIMVLSLAFSVWVFNEASKELRINAVKFGQPGLQSGTILVPETVINKQLAESRGRIILSLVYLNLMVGAVGAVGSYFLARRTMRPIELAMQAQAQFTADASHELRTPLAAMRTDIEVTLRDAKRTPAEVERLLNSNLEEITRLTHLSDSLLTLARQDQPPQAQTIRADVLLRRVIARYAGLATAASIKVVQHSPRTLITTDGDVFEKVLGILLDNAIKYSPPHTTVVVTLTVGQQIKLAVQDQGPGISPADQPRIFDRFYRADNARSQQHVAGHGLGLAIAQKLVESMGGTIEVTSDGKGALFTVHLPQMTV